MKNFFYHRNFSLHHLAVQLPKTFLSTRSIWALLVILSTLLLHEGCTEPYTQGKALYEANCSRCHGMDGKGFEDLYPGILQSPYIHDPSQNLACVITYGSAYLDRNKEVSSEMLMPENQHLTAVEVLNIINYLSWEFGSKKQQRIERVMQILEDCDP